MTIQEKTILQEIEQEAKKYESKRSFATLRSLILWSWYVIFASALALGIGINWAGL